MATSIFELVGRISIDGMNKMEKAIAGIDAKLKAAENGFKSFGEKAEAAGEKLAGFGEGVSKYLGLPIAGIGTAAAGVAIQWDSAAAQMANSLGLTTEQAEGFTETAKRIWSEGFGSTEEVIDAISQVGVNLSNLPAEDLERITTLTIAFNKSFGTDSAESTRTMNTLMANFGITAEEALDLMTYGMQNGANISGDLLDVLNEYGTQFANMGFSSEEFMDMLVRGSQAGIFSMDKLGDSVKESFLKISEGGDEQADWLKKMGLNTKQVMNDIAAGGDKSNAAFMSVMAGIAAIPNEADRTRAAIALLGTPIEDLGPQYATFFSETSEGLEGVEGGAQRTADNMEQTFGQRFQSTLNKTMLALEPLGNILLDLAEEYLPKIEAKVEQLSNWFGSLSAENRKWIVILGLAAVAAGPLLVVFGNLIRVFGFFGKGMGNLIGLFVKNEKGVSKAGNVFRGFGNIVRSTGNVLKSIGTGAVNVFKGSLNLLTTVFTKVGAAARLLGSGALTVLRGAFSFITSAGRTLISVGIRIASFLGNVIPMAARVLGTALRFLALTPMGLIITAVTAAIAIGIALYKNWDTVKVYLTAAWTVIKNAFQTGTRAAISFVTNLYSGAVAKFNSLRSTASTVFNNIKTAITSRIREAVSTGLSFVSNLVSGAREKFNTVFSTAKSIFGKVKSAITKPIEEAKTTVSGIIDNIIGFFDNLKGKFKFPKIDIPIPKISLTTATKNVLGKDITYPTGFDVDWYDQGGIFNKPSIIGVGERRPEFVGALDDLRQIVREEAGSGTGSISVEIPVILDGREIARVTAPHLERERQFIERQDARNRGRRL